MTEPKRKSQRKLRQEERNWRPSAIVPLTHTQGEMLEALEASDCVVATGPAGTGKTHIACAFGGKLLHERKVDRIILSRPLVGMGRTAGFLPGKQSDKLAPWVRPLVNAFKQQMASSRFEQALLDGSIAIESLEHISGLTFDNAVMILDEAQNTTPIELEAFLTRIGQNSKVIVCGDLRQRGYGQRGASGLALAEKAIADGRVPSARLVRFTSDDVVRSELCRQWGIAFEAYEAEGDREGLDRILAGRQLAA